MRKIIQQITQNLVDRLPENDQYYRLEDLRSLEFPSFIVRRIGVELKRNLSDSMIIPKTDWANTNTDAVHNAWQQFIEAIRNEARLPASYAQAVIETAVSDVLELLVQPRTNITEIIFGLEEELTVDQVLDRLEAIVVYRHFSVLISRYLQKKDVERLTKKRCAKIIATADEKLTTGYSPLDWSQMLEPLFLLMDGEIDTNLLRLFYEDRNMPRIARKFDLMDDVVSRAEFIEGLSSPDLLDFDGYEDDQSSLFEDQPSEDNTQEHRVEHEKKEKKKTDSEPDDVKVEESDSSDELISKSSEVEDEQDEEDDSLNAVFQELSDNGVDEKNTAAKEEPPEVELEQETEVEQDKEVKSEKVEPSPSENGTKSEDTGDTLGKDNTEEEETPMWMRYMSDEEIEEFKQEQADEEDENVDEDGFIDEPIIDLTQEDASDKEINRLMDLLEKDRELFVEQIFRGSDRAFDQAVEDIASYDSWRDVSKYIEKDVFKRNMVDMYSEAAVDFTDQLQTYFLEKQNRNKQEN